MIGNVLRKRLLTGALLLLGFSLRAVAEEGRYAAELNDGSRIAGNDLKNWQDEKQKPTLNGRGIFDENNPFRWLIDESLSPAAPPDAFVEFFGGDRLPGEVVEFRSGQGSAFLPLPKHLLVNPSLPLHMPRLPRNSPVRVGTQWLKRVVWQPRSLDLYDPGHAFLKDGRQIAFRSLRWGAKSVTLLLEDGIQEIFFNDLLEIHFPLPEVWPIYFQQMAVLSPQSATDSNKHARIMQLETTDGLKATVSTERLQPFVHGNRNQIASWYHQCQPAWSLDPFWVRFDSVWCRRFFWPHQVPLTMIAPLAVKQDSPLGSSWHWQQDRNVYRQPLKSGGRDFGWGFGVHAFHEIAIPLPAFAQSFRTRAGLDQSVGKGGCIQWKISLRGEQEKTLYQSPVVQGTNQVLDTGRLALEKPNDPKFARELVLSVDPLLTKGPAGSDPLDIRDSLNWLEPELELDREQLHRELSRQALSQVPVLADWELETDPSESLVLSNTWEEYDREDPRYRVLLASRGPFVSLKKSLRIGVQDRWLVLAVNRPAEKSPGVSLLVEIEGTAIADLEIPAARDVRGPDPLLIPVDSFRGRTVSVRLIQFPTPSKNSPPKPPQDLAAFAVDWRGISLCAYRPGLLPLLQENEAFLKELSEGEGTAALDDAAPFSGKSSVKITPPERGQSRLPGLQAPIRAVPRLGEYRLISFAWKKTDGQNIALAIAHDGIFGGEVFGNQRPRVRRDPNLNPNRKVRARRPWESFGRGLEFGYRYLRGLGKADQAPALKLDRKLPKDWQRLDRDVFGDFGEFTLTGFSLICPDGEAAWFDEIYLARDYRDLENLPSRRHPQPPPSDPNILKAEIEPERFGLVASTLTGPFAISDAGEGVRLLKEHQGKTNILQTRPRDRNTPCVLRAPFLLPAKQKCRLGT